MLPNEGEQKLFKATILLGMKIINNQCDDPSTFLPLTQRKASGFPSSHPSIMQPHINNPHTKKSTLSSDGCE